jgi:predicted aminopeptidase
LNALFSTPLVIAGTLLACGIAAAQPASSAPAASSAYSPDEHARLTQCIGMADNVQSIAEYKLAGRSALNVKMMYAPMPTGAQVFPTIDRVFGDAFTHAGDYAVAYFKACAVEMAQIPADRVAPAAVCMQNAMTASAAKKLKDAGATRESATEQLVKPGNDARGIVEAVYAQSKTRMEGQLDTWNACISPPAGASPKP